MSQASTFVALADRDQEDAIYRIRLTSYLKASEFTVNEPESLKWSDHDDGGLVLAAYDADGNILATTSAILLCNKDEAEKIMECVCDSELISFPAILLGKGATREGVKNRGIHSVLRYHLLRAIQGSPIKSLLGIVFENAPRTSLMRKIGYEFVYPERFWFTDLTPKTATMIGILTADQFEHALQLLGDEISQTIHEFPLKGKSLKGRLKQMMKENEPVLPGFNGQLIVTRSGNLGFSTNGRDKGKATTDNGSDYDNDGIPYHMFGLLPSIDAKPGFVRTTMVEGASFHFLDPDLKGPVISENADQLLVDDRDKTLLRFLGRIVDYSDDNNEETSRSGARLVEPGVGRTFLVGNLSLPNDTTFKDFSATGIGLTPYSKNGFVSVGRTPDGKVALIRAQHRKRLGDQLNALGCRSPKVVAIIEIPNEQVQMMDGSYSPRAIVLRAFRNVLRVKQIDPLAGFYHSVQHSAKVSAMIVEDLAHYLSLKTDEPSYHIVSTVSAVAAEMENFTASSDDFYNIVSTQDLEPYRNLARGYRQQILKRYYRNIITAAAEKVSAELGRPLTIGAYLSWYVGALGRQLAIFREARFLHDYHHPGVSRYTDSWIYTLIEHNLTLSCEFADLETSVFVDNPLEEIKGSLQITTEDVMTLRKQFLRFHNKDYEKAKRVAESFCNAAVVGGVADEGFSRELMQIFETNYKS